MKKTVLFIVIIVVVATHCYEMWNNAKAARKAEKESS
jgi:hypothetical protein